MTNPFLTDGDMEGFSDVKVKLSASLSASELSRLASVEASAVESHPMTPPPIPPFV